MMDDSVLMRVESAFRPLLIEGNLQAIGSAVMRWGQAGLTVRVVRGRKMQTLQGLFDEFAAAFQFPLYFGENADAFNECISELEEPPPGEGYVVVITDPDVLLVGEDSVALRWIVHSLEGAAGDLGQPIEIGEAWDRPAVPFHVVLAASIGRGADTFLRWTGAGADVIPVQDLTG